MNPSVSIIVPVYNAHKTIARCIESIINQEFQDFELLLVNDGSKDDSGQICDSYAAQDKRIRVIHKDNSGVSDSRNMALDLAKGKYIQFLDSDDWITTDATNLFFRAAEDHHCDMVISDFYRVVGQRVSHKGDIDDDAVMTREDYAAHMMENPADFYYGVLWNKFFRREIIEQYHLRIAGNQSVAVHGAVGGNFQQPGGLSPRRQRRRGFQHAALIQNMENDHHPHGGHPQQVDPPVALFHGVSLCKKAERRRSVPHPLCRFVEMLTGRSLPARSCPEFR